MSSAAIGLSVLKPGEIEAPEAVVLGILAVTGPMSLAELQAAAITDDLSTVELRNILNSLTMRGVVRQRRLQHGRELNRHADPTESIYWLPDMLDTPLDNP